MARHVALAVAVLFLALSAFAQKDLKSRADSASGGDKAKFAAQYTEEATKAADKAFNDGKDDEGSAELKIVAQYGRVAADAAMQSRKHEKDTEIKLRKILKRLVDLKQARPFEQQAEVQKAIQAVQSAHDDLLEFMFKMSR